MQTSSVYYGDCLKHLTQWSNWNRWDANNNARLKMDRKLADLIYLDPPWNSKAKYNILYERAENKAKGHTAQATAFKDIWHWTDAAAERLARITQGHMSRNDPLYPIVRARQCIAGLKQVLGKTGMLAYLTFMAERLGLCRELLKDTGSIYLHCDPTASHYLKTVMDAIFGKENYRNDIVWSYRTGGASKKHFSRKHEYIFFYCKNHKANPTFNPQMEKSYTKAKGRKPGKINYGGGGDRILRR